MNADHPITLLMFGTLAAVLIIILALALSFFRKRRNRHPMAGKRERNIDEIVRDGSDSHRP